MSTTTTRSVTPMSRAVTDMVMDHPFFAVLALRTKIKVDKNCPTAWCDGLTISYNPAFLAKLDKQQAVGLLVHELYHKIFMHHLRRGSRDPKRWNIACDYAINLLVTQIPNVKLPGDGLIDPQYAGMTAEQIYDILPPQPQCDNGSGSSDPGGCGEVRDPEDGCGMTRDEIESKLKQDINTAVKVAQNKGKLPAGMEIYLNDLLDPQVPWKHVLRRFMTERERADFTWSRPNRRFVARDLYMPAMESQDAAGVFCFGADTSGSMMGEPLRLIMSEVNAVLEEVMPSRSYIIYCDADVGRVDEFDRGQPLEIHPTGGGGTDFRPVFDWIEENGVKPKCLIFATDGYGTFPDQEPAYPVLWLMTEDVEPPFGESLRIEV